MSGFGGFKSASAYLRDAKPVVKDNAGGAAPQNDVGTLNPKGKRSSEVPNPATAKRHAASVASSFFKPGGAGPGATPSSAPGRPTKTFKPSDPSLPFAEWPEEEKEQWKAKKKAQEAKADAKKAERLKSRQGSIFGAFAKAADLHKSTDATRNLADDLPIQIKQKILSNVPAGSLRDARAISKAWRAAVDDETFQRFAKMAAHLGAGQGSGSAGYEATTSAHDNEALEQKNQETETARLTSRRVAVGTWMVANGAVDCAGLVKFLANASPRPFKTPLTTCALVRAVRDAERVLERKRFDDASTSGPSPGAGLADALTELATWRLPKDDGWALLALAVFVLVENACSMSFLFQAAESAGRTSTKGAAELLGVVAEFCPRQDLDEFASLLVAAMSSPTWVGYLGDGDTVESREGNGISVGSVHTARLARMAHVNEAVGTLELTRARMFFSTGNQKKRTLTHEQLAVVSGDLAVDQVMLVRAFAGTGKTTTLLEYVKRRPGHTFAYLTFNRAIMEEAKRTFPKNTKALSFHGLAFRKFGFPFKHKLLRGNLRAHHAQKTLKLPSNDDRGILAIRTLQAFLISADDTVTETHAPPASEITCTYEKPAIAKRVAEERNRREETAGSGAGSGSGNGHDDTTEGTTSTPSTSTTPSTTPASDLAILATKLWLAMKDKTCDAMPMTDAGYLKLYQLSKPRLDKEYDVLLLDEAQDAAPVMADIVLSQRGCAKILVGDPHQEIYSFMGAKNAMAAVLRIVCPTKITQRRLSRSFRFGVEIAGVANSILRLKGETAPVLGAASEERGNFSSGADASAAVPEGVRVPLNLNPGTGDLASVDAVVQTLKRENETAAVKVCVDYRLTLQAHAPVLDKTSGRWVGRRQKIGHKTGQLTVLCRSNASLFESAELIMSFPGAKLGVVGGLESLKLDTLLDVYRLAYYTSEDDLKEIGDKYVSSFAKKELAYVQNLRETGKTFDRHTHDSLQNLKHQSQLSDDKDMATRIGIVKRLRNRLPDLIEGLNKNAVAAKSHASAHFLLSTAHKSKGLEYDSVLLWNDFAEVASVTKVRDDRYVSISASDEFGVSVDPVASDEINLLYVAATRAKKELFLPPSLVELHGGFPRLSGRNIFKHNRGVDAEGRWIQGGPGAVVALRAFGEITLDKKACAWNEYEVSADAPQMDADARVDSGLSVARMACQTCETSALACYKDGGLSRRNRDCLAGLAMVSGRVKNGWGFSGETQDNIPPPLTRVVDRDFHTAVTKTWWGDYCDLSNEHHRNAFQGLVKHTRHVVNCNAFHAFHSNAGAWEKFWCPACLTKKQEMIAGGGFNTLTATEHASAMELMGTMRAETELRAGGID